MVKGEPVIFSLWSIKVVQEMKLFTTPMKSFLLCRIMFLADLVILVDDLDLENMKSSSVHVHDGQGRLQGQGTVRERQKFFCAQLANFGH